MGFKSIESIKSIQGKNGEQNGDEQRVLLSTFS